MFHHLHPAVSTKSRSTQPGCTSKWITLLILGIKQRPPFPLPRYNLTVQLRSKIDGLGNLLLGMGAARRKVPWPTWFNDYSDGYSNLKSGGGFSDESGVTSPLSASQNFPAGIAAALPAMSRDASVQDMEQVMEDALGYRVVGKEGSIRKDSHFGTRFH